nr:hypothetical protein [uncultured Hyphomonas sp.]
MSGNEVGYLNASEIIGGLTIMAGLAAGYIYLFAVVVIVTMPLLIASQGAKAALSLTVRSAEAGHGLLSRRNVGYCYVQYFDRMAPLFAFRRSSKDSISFQLQGNR